MPTTVITLKRLTRPVPNLQAAGTGLRGVLRRNSNNFYSSLNTLVFEKLTELIEGPRIRAASLSLAPGLLVGSLSFQSNPQWQQHHWFAWLGQ